MALFNKKPKAGIEMLQNAGLLGPEPADIAAFLSRTQGLSKTVIGDYLGEREPTALKVRAIGGAFLLCLDLGFAVNLQSSCRTAARFPMYSTDPAALWTDWDTPHTCAAQPDLPPAPFNRFT